MTHQGRNLHRIVSVALLLITDAKNECPPPDRQRNEGRSPGRTRSDQRAKRCKRETSDGRDSRSLRISAD